MQIARAPPGKETPFRSLFSDPTPPLPPRTDKVISPACYQGERGRFYCKGLGITCMYIHIKTRQDKTSDADNIIFYNIYNILYMIYNI